MVGLAVVTGASSGIERSYAERLASNGMDVVVVAREAGHLDALKRDLERRGVRVRTIVADLGRAEDVQRLSVELAKLPVELLVNNAGLVDLDLRGIGDAPAVFLVASRLFHSRRAGIVPRSRVAGHHSGTSQSPASVARNTLDCLDYSRLRARPAAEGTRRPRGRPHAPARDRCGVEARRHCDNCVNIRWPWHRTRIMCAGAQMA